MKLLSRHNFHRAFLLSVFITLANGASYCFINNNSVRFYVQASLTFCLYLVGRIYLKERKSRFLVSLYTTAYLMYFFVVILIQITTNGYDNSDSNIYGKLNSLFCSPLLLVLVKLYMLTRAKRKLPGKD